MFGDWTRFLASDEIHNSTAYVRRAATNVNDPADLLAPNRKAGEQRLAALRALERHKKPGH
jgi:hypothetical protein